MIEPLIQIIGAFPQLAEKLLTEHADDGTGHCRACPLGAQAGHHRWPCSIHSLATKAVRRR